MSGEEPIHDLLPVTIEKYYIREPRAWGESISS